jgi:hypothetical protein
MHAGPLSTRGLLSCEQLLDARRILLLLRLALVCADSE